MTIPRRPGSKRHHPAPDTAGDDSPAPIPVTLPHVIVTASPDDVLTVTVDGQPYEPPPGQEPWRRSAFGTILDGLSDQRRRAVRVEVREADGSTFTDILAPATRHRARTPEPPPSAEPAGAVLAGLDGAGFVPGEDVAVAIVISRRDAAPDGSVRALIDASLLDQSPTREVILLGRVSGTFTIGHPG